MQLGAHLSYPDAENKTKAIKFFFLCQSI